MLYEQSSADNILVNSSSIVPIYPSETQAYRHFPCLAFPVPLPLTHSPDICSKSYFTVPLLIKH